MSSVFRSSRPPSSRTPSSLRPPHSYPNAPRALPSDEDRRFVDALSQAGLLGELADEELERIAHRLELLEPGPTRQLTLLELYYSGDGNAVAAVRRRTVDRFFVYRDGDPVTAQVLIERLAILAPELADIELEKLGEEGPLVVRSGEDVAGVVDDYDEDLDTGEIDLRSLEDGQTVSVRGLVSAMNKLLARHHVEERLVPLRADMTREAYIALDLKHAQPLCERDYLEEAGIDELLEFACWEPAPRSQEK